MSYAHSVVFIVRGLAFVVVSIDLALVGYIFYRRVSRNHYYARKDAAQKRFAPTVAAYLASELSASKAAGLLQTVGRAEREAVKDALLSGMTGATRRQATELLIALGYVQEWAEQAFGKRWPERRHAHARRGGAAGAIRRMRVFAVRRAVAVAHLGRLSPEWSGRFMQLALADPSPQVARLGIAALGRNPIPDGVPLLLRELHKAVVGQTGVPTRSIKTALVHYPIGELGPFTAWMEHANPRFRFLAVDTVREICRKSADQPRSAFPAALRQWFLVKSVNDPSADVRARGATVIGWFQDAEAGAQLRRLLQDENEFVRLHAVRACADPCSPDLLEDVLCRVTDTHWRVREAAVRTLGAFPGAGRQALERLFLSTTDRYASEQIADEIQRSGLVAHIIPLLASPNGEKRQAFEVCAKMARLGMDSFLIEDLAEAASSAVRPPLLRALAPSGSPQLVAALRRIAGNQMDPLRAQAQEFLRAHLTGSAAWAGGD